MKRLVISRWDDLRIVPKIHVCQQIDTKGQLHKRGAIVLNWLYWSIAFMLVETD